MIAARAAQSPEYYLTPDCPMEGQGIEASWGGNAAGTLGLTDKPFGSLSFLRMAKGLNPETGSKLTARIKENRKEATDVCVTVPKAVSVLIEVAGDERVKKALWSANDYAMKLYEKKACARVRKGGVYADRRTGSMAWASFYHGTTRPIVEPVAAFSSLDGTLVRRRGANDNQRALPDPHAHIHNYLVNITHDRADEKTPWKALKRHHFDLPQIEAKFHKRLAKELRKIGYDAKVETKSIQYRNLGEVPDEHRDRLVTARGRKPRYVTSTLRVKGVSDEVADAFSRRQDGIKAVESERAASDQKMTEAYKARASQMIRQPKSAAGELSRSDVHRFWVGRMTGGQFGELADTVAKTRRASRRAVWRESAFKFLDRVRQTSMVRQVPERSRGNGWER